MLRLFALWCVLISLLLAVPHQARAQTQTFFVTASENEAAQVCATRFTARLVNYKNFRATQDANTQRAVSDCLGNVAGASAQRSCAVSMANIEVDFLIRIRSVALGGDWSWTIEALSPSQGGDQVWGGVDLPAGKADRLVSAYEACDLLAAKFACSQETLDGCADTRRIERTRSAPLAPPATTPATQQATVGESPPAAPTPTEVTIAPAPDPSISGWLTVANLSPSGARVSVDGEEVGVGNGEYLVEAGSRRVVVSSPGYEDFQTTIRISVGAIETLNQIKLKRVPSFLVTREIAPSGALIFVDGKKVGTAPGRVEVAVGDHLVTIWSPGWESVQRKIRAGDGGTSIIEKVELKRLQTRFSLAVAPNNATIRLDGRTVSEPSARFRPNRFGIQVQDVDDQVAAKQGLDMVRGALVTQVADGSPAATAGLRAQDIVLGIGTAMVTGAESLVWSIQNGDATQRTAFQVWRDNQLFTLSGALAPLDAEYAGYRFEVAPGPHVLEVAAEGFESRSIEVSVASGDAVGLAPISLKELPSRIRVTSPVEGAEVYLDGRQLLVLQADKEAKIETSAGAHEIVVGLSGFASYAKTLNLQRGAEVAVDAQLKDLEALRITVSRSFGFASIPFGFDLPASGIARSLDCEEGCDVIVDKDAALDGIWHLEFAWDQGSSSSGPSFEWEQKGGFGLFVDFYPSVPVTVRKTEVVFDEFTEASSEYTRDERLTFSRTSLGFGGITPRNGFDLDFGFGESLEIFDVGQDTTYGFGLLGFTEIYLPLSDTFAARLTYGLNVTIGYLTEDDTLFESGQRVSLGFEGAF